MTWNAEFSVGIKQFDEQHKKLVGMINELYDAMKAGKTGAVLGGLFNELVEYTLQHFMAEEMLMKEHGYPGYQAHLAEHKKLTAEVVKFKEKFDKSGLGLGVELLPFLTDWLKHHINGTDKLYGKFFSEKGLS
jgi:hemerythrin-like metal-binding protein